MLATMENRLPQRRAESGKRIYAWLVLIGTLLVAPAVAGPPAATKAPPVAAKPTIDPATEAKYQELVASLPPAQQAWERTLQENLGSFYLPLHKRARVAGRSTCWDFVADDPKLPRVLLIGDSISGGYTLGVRKELAGRANVHKAPENCGSTANGLKKLDLWLADKKWDLIHFNFGLHDTRTAPDVYEKNLEQLVARLEKTGARLVWASTTPAPPDTKSGPTIPAAVIERNKIAARVMQSHKIVIDDLYRWIERDLSKYQNPADVHFNGDGYAKIARRVARVIETTLPCPPDWNTATRPVMSIEVDQYGWEARHAAVLEAKKQFQPQYVLVGDSITHCWGGLPDGGKVGNRGVTSWNALFGDRALNLGFGWDRTQNVLKRIELGELDGLDPKAVVVHIGTNNLAATPQSRRNTPAEIAEAIGLVVERIQAKCPRAQVILMAIFPRGRGTTNADRQAIEEINRMLAPLGQKPRVTLLDITAKWLAADGSVSAELMPDYLHPNEKGYAVWAEALRPLLPK